MKKNFITLSSYFLLYNFSSASAEFDSEQSRRVTKLSPSPFPLSSQRGQALITLLFFVLIGISIISASAVMVLNSAQTGTKFQEGSIVYGIAQSGVDNAMLRLLRDPAYTGEVLLMGSGNASITVVPNGTNAYKVVSVGTMGNFKRTIEANVVYTNNAFQITSRKEL